MPTENSLFFFVSNRHMWEMPSSPLESQRIWALEDLPPPPLVTHPCLDGWLPFLPQDPEAVLGQGCASPAAGQEVSGWKQQGQLHQNIMSEVLGISMSCSRVPGSPDPSKFGCGKLQRQLTWSQRVDGRAAVVQKQLETILLRDQGPPLQPS